MNGERVSSGWAYAHANPTRLGETRATYSAENPEHLAALKAELGASPPVQLHITLRELFMLVAQLQLAIRHPQNDGPSRDFTRQFIDGTIEIAFNGKPMAQDILRMGDVPDFDE